MRPSLLVLLSVCLNGVAASSVSARPPSSNEVAQQLRDLDAEDDALDQVMQIETIGKSVQKRDILLVRLEKTKGLPCVYVICRQHGDEAAPTQAALQLIRDFVTSGEQQALLSRVALCIVPIANPDGADAYKRNNASGVNLNRDWAQQSQPETRAIARSIARSHAKVVIDAHENYPWEPWGAYLESGHISSILRKSLLSRVTDAIVREAEPEQGLRRSRGGAGVATLAHRHFSKRGIPALLLESQQTSAGGDIDQRQALHREAIATTLRVVAESLVKPLFPRPVVKFPILKPSWKPRPQPLLPQPYLKPPVEEALPSFALEWFAERSLDEYEFTLGPPRLIVEAEQASSELRFYQARNLAWVVLTRRVTDGHIRKVELQFVPGKIKTWQSALKQIGLSADGVTATMNPDQSVNLQGITGIRNEARWVPSAATDKPAPSSEKDRLQFSFLTDKDPLN